MDRSRLVGDWKQVKGRVKRIWGQLTDDDLDVIAGRRDQLIGKIEERYGIARGEAARQVREWERADRRRTTRT